MHWRSALSYGGIVGMVSLAVFCLRLWLKRRRVSLRGKVVLITGASSGVGEACAHVFYQAGAKLILCARRETELLRCDRGGAGFLGVWNNFALIIFI